MTLATATAATSAALVWLADRMTLTGQYWATGAVFFVLGFFIVCMGTL